MSADKAEETSLVADVRRRKRRGVSHNFVLRLLTRLCVSFLQILIIIIITT